MVGGDVEDFIDEALVRQLCEKRGGEVHLAIDDDQVVDSRARGETEERWPRGAWSFAGCDFGTHLDEKVCKTLGVVSLANDTWEEAVLALLEHKRFGGHIYRSWILALGKVSRVSNTQWKTYKIQVRNGIFQLKRQHIVG